MKVDEIKREVSRALKGTKTTSDAKKIEFLKELNRCETVEELQDYLLETVALQSPKNGQLNKIAKAAKLGVKLTMGASKATLESATTVKGGLALVREGEFYTISIISNANGVKGLTVEANHMSVSRTYLDDVKGMWEVISASGFPRKSKILIKGLPKSLGRSEMALDYSNSQIKSFWQRRGIRFFLTTKSGKILDVTDSNGFEEAKSEALKDNESRSIWQYLAHSGIDRLTAPFKYMLRERYSLDRIMNGLALAITVYNDGRKANKRPEFIKISQDDVTKMAKAIYAYMLEYSNEFSIFVEELSDIVKAVEYIARATESSSRTAVLNNMVCFWCGTDLKVYAHNWRRIPKFCPECGKKLEFEEEEEKDKKEE